MYPFLAQKYPHIPPNKILWKTFFQIKVKLIVKWKYLLMKGLFKFKSCF